MRTICRTVEAEVDIEEFPDADILEAAGRIMERTGGSSMLGDGPETPIATLARLVGDLATSIASGDRDEALRRLDDLVRGDSRLRDAVDIGRRRCK